MQALKTKGGAMLVALAVTLVVCFGVLVAQAFAQAACYQAMCSGSEPYYGGDSGNSIVCNSGPGIGGSLDHTVTPCPSGTTLVPNSGYCRTNVCAGGPGPSCEERGICTDSQWPYYLPGSDDAGRNTAACGTAPQPFTNALAHIVAHCPDGFSLVAGLGICRRCPTVAGHANLGGVTTMIPHMILQPDLVIRAAYVRTQASAVHVTSLHRGRPYLACFTVANIGTGASAAFRVGGGGLGVPVAPYQDHAGLAAGATRDGCLTYPTTPAPGLYNLGLTVDSLHAVTELREDNNGAVIHVVVTP